MAKRFITSILGLPVVILLIVMGGMWLRYALLVVSLIGLYEFYRAVSGRHLAIHGVGYVFTAVYFSFFLGVDQHTHFLVLLTLFVITAQSCLVVFYKKIALMDCIATISGFFYVPFLLSFVFLVRGHEYGTYFVWLIFISSFGSDTSAYLVGRAFGRRKLTGTPSPGKSWEGVVGGVAGATAIGAVYGFVIADYAGMDGLAMAGYSAVVCFAGAIFSQFGDLFASAVKRHTGIKDFGSLLPGHGGILDRFDSVIVTAPVVYIVMVVLV